MNYQTQQGTGNNYYVDQEKRIKVIGYLTTVPRYFIIQELDSLVSRGYITQFDRFGNLRNLIELLADTILRFGLKDDLQNLINTTNIKFYAVNQDLYESLLAILERAYNYSQVYEKLQKLAYYGVLESPPVDLNEVKAYKLLAKTIIEAAPILKDKFPGLLILLDEARSRGMVDKNRVEQAINYLETINMETLRNVLRMLTKQTLQQYNPSRSKKTLVKEIIFNVIHDINAHKLNNQIVNNVLNILSGRTPYTQQYHQTMMNLVPNGSLPRPKAF